MEFITPLDVTIVLPAFNERGHIKQEINRIKKAMATSRFTYEILVIDDGSTDGTHEEVQEGSQVRLIRLRHNQGSGTSRRIGTQEALGEVVVWTDADMSYPNDKIPQLVEELHDSSYRQLVGARTSEEGTHKWARVPAKWMIRKLAEFLSGQTIPDLNSGFRAFYREDALPHLWLLPEGFSCVTTITLAFMMNGLSVGYTPITYSKRAGKSHFHPFRDAYRYGLQVVRMMTLFAPLRVFAPPALTLIAVGILKVVFDILKGLVMEGDPFKLAVNTVLILMAGLILISVGLLADLIVKVSQKDQLFTAEYLFERSPGSVDSQDATASQDADSQDATEAANSQNIANTTNAQDVGSQDADSQDPMASQDTDSQDTTEAADSQAVQESQNSYVEEGK